jgi:hypothetical protein
MYNNNLGSNQKVLPVNMESLCVPRHVKTPASRCKLEATVEVVATCLLSGLKGYDGSNIDFEIGEEDLIAEK